MYYLIDKYTFALTLRSKCYDLKLKVLSNKTTLVLSNTRELDRELFYKLIYLI